MDENNLILVEKNRSNIVKRLNRIEGQIKGIRKMVEANQCCSDILVQVSAVRSATNKVGLKILENYSQTCIKGLDNAQDKDIALEELLKTLERYMKFSN